MLLEVLLIVAFGGAFLTYLFGKISSRLRDVFAVLVSLALVVITCLLYNKQQQIVYFVFFDNPLILRSNMLSWFFGITIVGIGLLSVIYSLGYMGKEEKLDYYYFIVILINASMIGTVFSGDFISFFIFWEIMSWSTFLLISYKGGKALSAGMKYIVMSIIGSMTMLVAIMSLYVTCGTLEFSSLVSQVQITSMSYNLFLLIMFGVVFTIINAFWPLHTWLPDAHAEAVSPFSSILSAVLVRKGLYGLYLVMYIILGLNVLNKLTFGFISYNNVFCFIGAVTIVFAAFSAFLQDDSKRILAWSTVGQGGYMILGIAFTTAIGLAGGMFHVLNHCIYIGLLFFVAGAVERQTGGIRDINKLGGLIKRMPVTFIGGVVGISGLIGLPLTCGFVSKWLIYKTLILGNRPFLAFAAFMGTWGTILYGYKFIHNIFLGQLPKEFEDVKEAPFSMRIPIILLTIAVILIGVLPGIPLKVINIINVSAGFESLSVNISGVISETGVLNTVNIFTAILAALLVVYLFFRTGAESERVPQEDSYAAGSYIPVGKYHYTVKFYDPFSRLVKPWLKDRIDNFYGWLTRIVEKIAERQRRIYTGDLGFYLVYIVLFLAALIFVRIIYRQW
jgi:formate hydrogenlyase subunit 3/multisubunit Na+/H+ antiporter MnhD subunit